MRPRREIRNPLSYADCINIVDTNSIAYVLAIVENIDADEPRLYKEVVQSKEVSEWLIA